MISLSCAGVDCRPASYDNAAARVSGGRRDQRRARRNPGLPEARRGGSRSSVSQSHVRASVVLSRRDRPASSHCWGSREPREKSSGATGHGDCAREAQARSASITFNGRAEHASHRRHRLKMPANYKIPPHLHKASENVTVLAGTFHMGLGEKFDQGSGQELPVGGFASIPPNHPHYAWAGKEETVVQVLGVGPSDLRFVNPADDPRQKK
jgi:quercetin dioxygenase-like cupin family protein